MNTTHSIPKDVVADAVDGESTHLQQGNDATTTGNGNTLQVQAQAQDRKEDATKMEQEDDDATEEEDKETEEKRGSKKRKRNEMEPTAIEGDTGVRRHVHAHHPRRHHVDEATDNGNDNEHGDSPTESGSSTASNSNSSNTSHLHSTGSNSPVRRIPPVLRPPQAMYEQPAPAPAPAKAAASNRQLLRTNNSEYTTPANSTTASQRQLYAAASLAPYPTATSLNMRSNHAPYYRQQSISDDRSFDSRMNDMSSSQQPPQKPQALMSAMLASNNNMHTSPRDNTNNTTTNGSAGQKRRFPYDHHHHHQAAPPVPAPAPAPAPATTGLTYEQQQQMRYGPSTSSSQAQRTHGDDEDPLRFETRGSHGPRDETRYETWTSKQLRKKCSHLKLRGLKNVKKHVMVDALYRYYRNLRQKEAAGASSADATPSNPPSSVRQQQQPQSQQQPTYASQAPPPPPTQQQQVQHALRYDHYAPPPPSATSSVYNNTSITNNTMRSDRGGSSSHSDHTTNSSHMSGSSVTNALRKPSGLYRLVGDNGTNCGYSMGLQEEVKTDALDNEIQVTPEDVIRLVDVVLSPDFVDRLAAELSRWQFWVDVREKYIALLKMTSQLQQQRANSAFGNRSNASDPSTSQLITPTRNFKWSSMQLWEIWKELTFAYTKTCFEFTTAGADERDYIKFCDGRPDVFYLHQRLHARPDLLHLIKSNEYIDEKCTSDAVDSISAANQAANAKASGRPESPSCNNRAHKRFRRLVPAPTYQTAATNGNEATGSSGSGSVGSSSSAGATGSGSGSVSGSTGRLPSAHGHSRGLSNGSSSSNNEDDPVREEGSNSEETTGEEGSNSDKTNGHLLLSTTNGMANATAVTGGDHGRREALAEQKYFGLLLQNFEAIFESLHNKKILLAALRKDSNAPDHLIADLHDDIHVLSALKKEFRNKLRGTLE